MFYYCCVRNKLKKNLSPGSLDKAIAYRIYRLSRRLRTNLSQFLSMNDFPAAPEHWYILYRLYENDDIPQGELADSALDDRANISRHIATLEKLNLIRRTTDAEDARTRYVSLSDKGHSLMEKIFKDVLNERERLFGDISKSELKSFLSVLDKIENKL